VGRRPGDFFRRRRGCRRFFFRVQAVGCRRRFARVAWPAAFAAHCGFILRQPLGQALHFLVEPSDGVVLCVDDVQQVLDRELAAESRGANLSD